MDSVGSQSTHCPNDSVDQDITVDGEGDQSFDGIPSDSGAQFDAESKELLETAHLPWTDIDSTTSNAIICKVYLPQDC